MTSKLDFAQFDFFFVFQKMGGWRKLWFVLQNQLLLSYSSKEDYEKKLAPFKDVLNLVPGTTVRPTKGPRFTIETSTNLIYTYVRYFIINTRFDRASSHIRLRFMALKMLLIFFDSSLDRFGFFFGHFLYPFSGLIPFLFGSICCLLKFLIQIASFEQRCDNNKECSEWITALVESLGQKSPDHKQ